MQDESLQSGGVRGGEGDDFLADEDVFEREKGEEGHLGWTQPEWGMERPVFQPQGPGFGGEEREGCR